MTISPLSSALTSTATTNSQTAAQAAEKADPITAGLQKSSTKLQSMLDTATASLSTLGKFKASVAASQTAAKALGTLKDTASSDEVKKALASFVSTFNTMVASTQSAAAASSGVERISRGMTRAMTADFSRVDALRQMGFTKASDGSLKLDNSKLEAAFKASPTAVLGTLSKLGDLVDKVATKELGSGGGIGQSVNTLSSKATVLQMQQNALLKAAQQYASFAQARNGSTWSA
nr:flagellar filament capping protein FliD [uncultured Rhodoferax sp.]